MTVRAVDHATGEDLGGHVRVGADPDKLATVVRLSGEFDIETVPSIETCLRRALGPFYHRRHVILDLSQTTFIDSTFISYLVKLASRIRQEGSELVLVRPLGPVRSVLLLVGLPNLIPVYDSLPQAVDSLRREQHPLIPPALPRQPAD